MSRETFKNRHGKIVTVDDESVTIESPQDELVAPVDSRQVELEVPKEKPKKKPKAKKAPVEVKEEPESVAELELVAPVFEAEPITVVKPEKKRRLSRSIIRRILTTIFVVAVIAVAAFIMMTQTAAQQHAAAEGRMRENVKNALSIKLKTEVGIDDALDQLLAAMPAIECPNLGILELSRQSRQAHQRCLSTHKAYESIRNEIKDIKPVAAYSQQLREILSDALTNPANGNFAEISKYAELWQTSDEKLKGIEVPRQITEGHKALTAAVSAVSSAWQKLQAANSARNGDDYMAAKDELSHAYESLKTASDQILKYLLPYQKSLSSNLTSFN